MNPEEYNLDTLREIIRKLQAENLQLKKQLKSANIAYESENPFSEKTEQENDYDPDQGARIISRYITQDMVRKFFTIFWGRHRTYML